MHAVRCIVFMTTVLSICLEIKSRINDWQDYLFQRLSGAKTFSAEFLRKVR